MVMCGLFSSNIENTITTSGMGFRSFMKSTILRMDLTCTPPTFRTFGQPAFETIFGGILSFIIMCFFSYVLAYELDRMLNSMDITYNSGIVDDITNQNDITDVHFAVAIEGVDLSATPKKFIIQLVQYQIDSSSGTSVTTTSTVPLSPCTLNQWSSLGSDFQTQYTKFGYGQMLCIDSGSQITLSGYQGSDIFKYASLQIHQCDITTDASCDTTTNINTFMTNHQNTNDYFHVQFYIVDTILTPTNTNAITKYLQKKIFLSFTTDMGSIGDINMAQYTLKTDQSWLPNTKYDINEGNYVQGYHTNAVSLHSTKYVNLRLYKSTKSLTVTRTLGKFDVVLSYVGGLLGLLFTAIAFLFGSYSTYRYQLYVAENMLSLNKKGKHIKESDLDFLTFFAYCCYDWLDAFGVPPTCFSHLKNIHDTREEACEQLDPTIMLKRIKYLEDVSKVLMNEHRQLCLHLSGPLTLQQAKRMRQLLTYYDRQLKDLPYDQVSEILEDKLSRTPESLSDKKKHFEEEGDMDEQQEIQFLENMMQQAMDKLDADSSEIGLKIKEMMTKKVKEEMRESQQRHKLKTKQLVIENFSELHVNKDGPQDSDSSLFKGFRMSKKVAPESIRPV